MRFIAVLAMALLTAATPEADVAPGPLHYVLDAPRSDVSAKVGFMGLASRTARFPGASGGLHMSPNRLDAVDLDVTLDARALTTADPVTLDRLKGPKFFDVERYPQLRFTGHRMVMTGDRTARLEGQLSARGVTRPIELDVRFAAPPARTNRRAPIRLIASVAIDRDDFGMTAYHFIVGRKVAITIDATLVPE